MILNMCDRPVLLASLAYQERLTGLPQPFLNPGRIAPSDTIGDVLILGLYLGAMLGDVIDRRLDLTGRKPQQGRDPLARTLHLQVFEDGVHRDPRPLDLRTVAAVHNPIGLHG